MNYAQHANHGFDIAELSGASATTPDHYAVLREHDRYFFAQVGTRGLKSLVWRPSPAQATKMTKARAEGLAELFPGRVVAGEVSAVAEAYANTGGNDNG